MRAGRALLCLLALLAGSAPLQAASVDPSEAKELLVKYRRQWIAEPDQIRDARIGAIYPIPLVGLAVCVAIDRLRVDGQYSGLAPLLLVIAKLEITRAPLPYQEPVTTYEYRVTASPATEHCAEAEFAPFPELQNVPHAPEAKRR